MVIYKIVEHIVERKRGNKPFADVEHKERIVIDNLDRAREIYNSFKNDAESWFQYSKYSGQVHLFIPKILDNGELAYHGETIDQFTKEV